MQRSSKGDGDKQRSFGRGITNSNSLASRDHAHAQAQVGWTSQSQYPKGDFANKHDLHLEPSVSRNIGTCDVFENYGTLASVPFLQMKSDSCKLASFYTFTRDVISPDPSRSITVSNVISHSIFNQIRRYCKNQRCNIAPRNPRLHLTSSEDDQKRRENSRQFHDFVSELGRYDLVAVGSIDSSDRLAFIKHKSGCVAKIYLFQVEEVVAFCKREEEKLAVATVIQRAYRVWQEFFRRRRAALFSIVGLWTTYLGYLPYLHLWLYCMKQEKWREGK